MVVAFFRVIKNLLDYKAGKLKRFAQIVVL